MRCKNVSLATAAVLAMFCITFLATTHAAAQTETVLYSFNFSAGDGAGPFNNLTFDKAGNLYGTTSIGGANNYGTVFELSPKTGGGWTETILHSFRTLPDGAVPNGGLIFDAAGNLYGTTSRGGVYGFGTAYELSPGSGGTWTLSVLHQFLYNTVGGGDGAYPRGSLVFDAAGNLYGTTLWGGTGPCTSKANLVGCGTVFELIPLGGGSWGEKTLHSFGNGTDGTFPDAGLMIDAAGNLYGVTNLGGTGPCMLGGNPGCGIVYELSPRTGGGWAEKLLHQFNGTDGEAPVGSLIFDAKGNLYGATFEGGANGWGTVFELMPKTGGGWGEKVLHSFNQSGSNGASPFSGVVMDAAGNLYGTTAAYGLGGYGNVYELMPSASGRWTEKVLCSFGGTTHSIGYGTSPLDSLVLDVSGNLYGTTSGGGAYNGGTVFQIKP